MKYSIYAQKLETSCEDKRKTVDILTISAASNGRKYWIIAWCLIILQSSFIRGPKNISNNNGYRI